MEAEGVSGAAVAKGEEVPRQVRGVPPSKVLSYQHVDRPDDEPFAPYIQHPVAIAIQGHENGRQSSPELGLGALHRLDIDPGP